MNLDGAKAMVLSVLDRCRSARRRRTDTEDHTGFMGSDPQGFERLVQFVEDRDPHWLARQLRDPRYLLGVRTEIAGMMRGVNANRLLLELLGAEP
jgi:hypothetical protein